MSPLSHQPSFHKTFLAPVQILLCPCRPPEQLLEHVLHSRCRSLPYLSEIRLLLFPVWFLHPTLHTTCNCLFVQHHFHRINPTIEMISRLQNANTKLTSTYYMNYIYIIQATYCEGTLRNFDPIKIYFLLLPLYAKTNRPLLVPIKYLKCVEGAVTKCMYVHSFNLLYRDWMTNKLDTQEPSAEETKTQPYSRAATIMQRQSFPCALAACLARDREFLEFFRDPDIWPPGFEFKHRT